MSDVSEVMPARGARLSFLSSDRDSATIPLSFASAGRSALPGPHSSRENAPSAGRGGRAANRPKGQKM